LFCLFFLICCLAVLGSINASILQQTGLKFLELVNNKFSGQLLSFCMAYNLFVSCHFFKRGEVSCILFGLCQGNLDFTKLRPDMTHFTALGNKFTGRFVHI